MAIGAKGDSMSLALTAPPLSPAHGDDTVSPPREREVRMSDLTKTSVPLPFMVTVIGLVIAMAMFVLQIKSDVRLIEERQQHQRETTQLQFDKLEALITSTGLRNANLSIAEELQKVKQDNIRLQEQLKQPGR